MDINAAGLALIKSFEGCQLTAYRCPAGVWTIGYGSTGPQVIPGKKITQLEAEGLLRSDLKRFEQGVSALGVELNENQFSALVSLAFNIGVENLRRSTLVKDLRAGDFASAADQFLVWDKAHGRSLPGLVRRRAAERKLFLAPVISS